MADARRSNITIAISVVSISMVIMGVIVGKVKGDATMAAVVQQVSETQTELLTTNAEQHKEMRKDISANRAILLKQEGYLAAIAEMAAKKGE